jgi:hypothetical protein
MYTLGHRMTRSVVFFRGQNHSVLGCNTIQTPRNTIRKDHKLSIHYRENLKPHICRGRLLLFCELITKLAISNLYRLGWLNYIRKISWKNLEAAVIYMKDKLEKILKQQLWPYRGINPAIAWRTEKYWLWAGRNRGRVWVPVESRIFSSARRRNRLWGPSSLLFNGYRGLFPRG